MKTLLNPQPSLSFHIPQPRSIRQLPSSALHPFLRRNKCCLTTAFLDSATIDQLGIPEFDIINPAVSTSYRISKFPQPNQTVLHAQGRVCTGPRRPNPSMRTKLFKFFDTILRSAREELKDEDQVLKAQLGAFSAAMTIRANAFPEATQWSEGEKRAVNHLWNQLVRALPLDVIFVADPEGSIMGVGSSIGRQYVGNGAGEMRLVGALREVLAGGHLGYEEVQGVLRDVLPLKIEDDECSGVGETLLSAFLIGQRMNRETDRELKAYCLAFDDQFGVRCLLLRLDPHMVNLPCFMVWSGCHQSLSLGKHNGRTNAEVYGSKFKIDSFAG